MNLKSIFIALFALVGMLVSACVTTSVKGYSDTDFKDYKFRKVMVRAPNVNFSFGALLETSMVKELKLAGIPAESFLQTFPPTREWRNDEVNSKLLTTGYDSIMYINLVDSESSTQTAGYMNSGSANTYGNVSVYGNQATYSGNTTYRGTTTPIVAFKRNTSTRVQVFDTRTAKIVWIGDAATKAGGAVFMGDEATSDDIAKAIVTALKEARHI